MIPEPMDEPCVDIIVDDAPQSGIFNMSMDEALLELAAFGNRTTVRIYKWSEPTVTLGYFQGVADGVASQFQGLPVVRRLSGGGAILHDHEITYSLTLPVSHSARHNPSSVYEIVHRAIIQLLQGANFNCQLRSEYDQEKTLVAKSHIANPSEEPFLCFLRRNPNDIVHQSGNKIVGSAQRRRKGVTLQHGSILLESSTHTPWVTGIVNLKYDFDLIEFRKALPLAIGKVLGDTVQLRDYSQEEYDLASAIEMRKPQTVLKTRG